MTSCTLPVALAPLTIQPALFTKAKTMKRICVFCGSSMGAREIYKEQCDRLAEAMVNKNIDLVYGGASIGLMGTIADAILKRGGKVIGVIPEHLQNYEISHKGLTELVVTRDMHERKAKMASLSDGFIALPGGIGTLEELIEIATWQQLCLHDKPTGLMNIDHYYDALIDFLGHSVKEQFLKARHLDNLLRSAEAEDLLDQMIYFSENTEKFLEQKIKIDR